MVNKLRQEAGPMVSDEWIDVGFESNVDEIQRRFALVKDAIRTPSSYSVTEFETLFDDLCRSIRTAKWEYSSILETYGVRYEGHGHGFVELVEEIASQVAKVTALRSEVRESFQRHAKEASEMWSERREQLLSPRAKASVLGPSRVRSVP